MTQRRPRQHDEAHLKFIRSLPCLVCGNNIETEAAHIRMIDRSVAKPMTGIATKSDDRFTVPLCGAHHRHQHDCGNEHHWWTLAEIDPIKIALALYSVSGEYELGTQIVEANCGPDLCDGCGTNRADPPSKLCPGCQAYQEHQQ